MIALLAADMPASLVYSLMLVLVVMLVGGIAIGWLLGRILGPRSGWRRQIERTAARPTDTSQDPWSESARRVEVLEDMQLPRPPAWPDPKELDFNDEADDRSDTDDDDPDAPPPDRRQPDRP